MITDLIIDSAHKRPCTYRDFQCPVRFKLGGKTFETSWSFFADADLADPETIASIQARTEAAILEALAAQNIREPRLLDGQLNHPEATV